MEKNSIIEDLIKLPSTFHRVQTKSVVTLLKEMGCFEILDKISINDIRIILDEHQKCIFEWLQYSEDKRCSSGWYFIQKTQTEYVVGYMDKEGNIGLYEEEYDDGLDACASFIKHEVDEIQKHAML